VFSIVKNVLKSMFHIDLLHIPIDYLHFVIIVDHFYGELGIKECNVEVIVTSFLFQNLKNFRLFRMQIECT